MKQGVLFLFILTLVLSACDKIPIPGLTKASSKPEQKEVKKEEIKINGSLLAKVNDWAIGLDDFNTYINNLRPMAQAQNL